MKVKYLTTLLIVLPMTVLALFLTFAADAGFYAFTLGIPINPEPFAFTWTISFVFGVLMGFGDAALVKRYGTSLSRYPVALFLILTPLQFLAAGSQYLGIYEGSQHYIASALDLPERSIFVLFTEMMLIVLKSLLIVAVAQLTVMRLKKEGALKARPTLPWGLHAFL